MLSLVGQSVWKFAEVFLNGSLLDQDAVESSRVALTGYFNLSCPSTGLHPHQLPRTLPILEVVAGRPAISLPEMVGALANFLLASGIVLKWIVGHCHPFHVHGVFATQLVS